MGIIYGNTLFSLKYRAYKSFVFYFFFFFPSFSRIIEYVSQIFRASILLPRTGEGAGDCVTTCIQGALKNVDTCVCFGVTRK